MSNKLRVVAMMICICLAWCASADQSRSSAATGDARSQQRDAAELPPVQIEMPMNMDEPMEGGMMKKGMMKSDVKKSAEKKQKKMEEMLEKEEQSMPPIPAHPAQQRYAEPE